LTTISGNKRQTENNHSAYLYNHDS